MLTINEYFLFESEEFQDLKIERTLNFSNEDKRDLERLFHEFVDTQRKINQKYQDLFISGLGQKSVDEWLNLWKSGNVIFYVLRKLDKIIGFCLVGPVHRAFKNSGYIHYLMIDGQYRSKGIGSFFFKRVIEDFKKEYPNKHLIINVFAGNDAARKLYEKVGFRPASLVMLKY